MKILRLAFIGLLLGLILSILADRSVWLEMRVNTGLLLPLAAAAAIIAGTFSQRQVPVRVVIGMEVLLFFLLLQHASTHCFGIGRSSLATAAALPAATGCAPSFSLLCLHFFELGLLIARDLQVCLNICAHGKLQFADATTAAITATLSAATLGLCRCQSRYRDQSRHGQNLHPSIRH